MCRHILVTLDGSTYSERALTYVSDLAAQGQARVTLLTVIPAELPFHTDSAAAGAQAEASWSYLRQQAAHVRDEGIANPAIEVRQGVPFRAIVETPRELAADLIVMSTQGLSADSEYRLGAVASKVLASAPCPVLMVRVERPAPPRTPAEERWQAEGGSNVG